MRRGWDGAESRGQGAGEAHRAPRVVRFTQERDGGWHIKPGLGRHTVDPERRAPRQPRYGT